MMMCFLGFRERASFGKASSAWGWLSSDVRKATLCRFSDQQIGCWAYGTNYFPAWD